MRSVIAASWDPRRADMKDILNDGSSIASRFVVCARDLGRQKTPEWFVRPRSSPAMLLVDTVFCPEQRALVPAIVHADGTTTSDPVDRAHSPLFMR